MAKTEVFVVHISEDDKIVDILNKQLVDSKHVIPWVDHIHGAGRDLEYVSNDIIPKFKHFIFLESKGTETNGTFREEVGTIQKLKTHNKEIKIYVILIGLEKSNFAFLDKQCNYIIYENDFSSVIKAFQTDNQRKDYSKLRPVNNRRTTVAKYFKNRTNEYSGEKTPLEKKSNMLGMVIRKFLKTNRKIIIVVFICIVVVADIILFRHYFTNRPKNNASNKETKQDTNFQTGNEKDTTIIKDTTVKPPSIVNEQDPLTTNNDNRNKIDTEESNPVREDKIIDITDEILESNFILETEITFEDDYKSEISPGNKKILNEICNKVKNNSNLILWLIQETNIPLKNRNDKELSNTFNERGKNVYDYFKINSKDVELKYKLDTPYVENTKKYNKLIIKIYRK
ncbi:MAG: hypothetical protein PHW82_08385 [Bacteroidales bacterium]|nr:hypothetical protein [Bacteroidales bacterium]